MKRLRWFWIVALLVLLPPLVVVVEHHRGRAALARTLAEFAARGEILDARRLLPPSVPAGSNGLISLVAAAARLGGAGQPDPPKLVMVDTGLAVPGTRMDRWEGTGQLQTQTWANVEIWLNDHADDFAASRASLERPACQSVIDPSRGFGHMDFSHLSRFKVAATALGISAAAAARRGDFDAAMRDLEAIRVVESDLGREPLLISQLVRIACGAVADRRAWSVLYAREWDDRQLLRLQRFMAVSDFVNPLLHSLEFERAVALQEFRDEPSDDLSRMLEFDVDQALAQAFGGGPSPLEIPGTLDEAYDTAGELLKRVGGRARQSLFPIWRYGWGDHSTVRFLRASVVLFESQREAARKGSCASVPRSLLDPWLEPTHLHERWCNRYMKGTLPQLANTETKAFRAETERALNETGIALLRHQRRLGRLPDSLDALVPEFLAAVPKDRMDGKPLRYRRDSETTFTLWSVADDFIDDGGRKPWVSRSEPNGIWWKEDAVWPQCASVEQIAAVQQFKPKPSAKTAPVQMSSELMKRYGLIPASAPKSTPTNAPAP